MQIRYEVTKTKYSKKLPMEVGLATGASILLVRARMLEEHLYTGNNETLCRP